MFKRITCTIVFIWFVLVVHAQPDNVVLQGKLANDVKASYVFIQNIDGIKMKIAVSKTNTFSVTDTNLPKGFYEMDKIGTIYLTPGYHLTVQPQKQGGYYFSGRGSLENNALQVSIKNIPPLLTLNETGELDSATYSIEPSVFLQQVDVLNKTADTLFNKSADTFFVKNAMLHIKFHAMQPLYLYSAFYGIDRKKMEQMPEAMRKVDHTAPDFTTKLMALVQSIHLKNMSTKDRQKIISILYTDWDKNDETLFRNSYRYRNALMNFIQSKSSSFKYSKPPKQGASFEDIKASVKLEDSYIKKLMAAKDEISNPYILSYFNYTFTKSILTISKDTATIAKYYNEYISTQTRNDYLVDIVDTYKNLIAFKNNTVAPSFSFKNVSGQLVSLESLKGKYVYIDVWATWCAPCKKEIPYLKEIEETYRYKNIQFVSISVDEPGNANKWKQFVKTNDLKGIQLITDNAFETSFIKKMSINSIPRFILIDPAGKIVSADALRPSNTELQQVLNKFL